MRNLVIKLTMVGLLAIGLTGCFKTTFLAGPNASGTPSLMYNGAWYHSVISGLADLSGPVPLNAVCPQGWARIEYERTFVNGLVESLTSGIYNPATVTIYCNGGAAYDAIKDGHGQIVVAIPRQQR